MAPPKTCFAVNCVSKLNPACSSGDEIEVLNDSWLFLIWCSDHAKFKTNSACSRWPIAVIPKSLYLMDNRTGMNLTVAAATSEIVESLKKLNTSGVKLRDLPSVGRATDTWFCQTNFQLWFQHV